MPFINAKISKQLTNEKETALKSSFGKAISLFPGKSESYLMCNIEDNSHLWFGGTQGDAAFLEVKLFGEVNSSSASAFTKKVCDDINEITGIPADRIYVRYTGGNDWGWNSSNF